MIAALKSFRTRFCALHAMRGVSSRVSLTARPETGPVDTNLPPCVPRRQALMHSYETENHNTACARFRSRGLLRMPARLIGECLPGACSLRAYPISSCRQAADFARRIAANRRGRNVYRDRRSAFRSNRDAPRHRHVQIFRQAIFRRRSFCKRIRQAGAGNGGISGDSI